VRAEWEKAGKTIRVVYAAAVTVDAENKTSEVD
jgi:hypothetical protein